MKQSRSLLAGFTTLLFVGLFFAPVQAANAVSISAASAVRSFSVTDAWSETTPRTARAKLRWTKPASTYGATIIGYKIEKSTDKKSWTTYISNTFSTATSVTISTGLKIASPNYFRVRAITRKGSSTKSGMASAIVSKTLTAIPSPPALLGLSDFTADSSGIKKVSWLPQSASQKGASKVTYTVAAETPGETPVTCSTDTAATCELTELTSGAKYFLKLTAINARGSVVNLNEYLPADQDFDKQWYLGTEHGVAATRAWTATRGSSSVVVAVLDTGITKHPDLEGQLVSGFDFVSDAQKSGDGNGRDSDPTDPGDWTSKQPLNSWHGTHVAGIIAGKQNSIGVSGVAPNVKIQPIRVLSAESGSANDMALAIRWAAGQDLNGLKFGEEILSKIPINKTPAKVINMSMAYVPQAGTNESAPCPGVIQSAINYARQKGITLVAAAGNGDDSQTPVDQSRVYPTNCDGPISVGATGFDGDVAYYSNFGQTLNLTAPGGDTRTGGLAGAIWSTSNDGKKEFGSPTYKYEEGTSMAAPIVSGIVALMYSLRPKITDTEVWSAISSSLDPFAEGSVCATTAFRCGAGAINATKSIEALISITG